LFLTNAKNDFSIATYFFNCESTAKSSVTSLNVDDGQMGDILADLQKFMKDLRRSYCRWYCLINWHRSEDKKDGYAIWEANRHRKLRCLWHKNIREEQPGHFQLITTNLCTCESCIRKT